MAYDSRERSPSEQQTLKDALDIATAIVDADTITDVRQHILAAGFLVLAGDLAAMLDAARTSSHYCGWCEKAKGSRIDLQLMSLDDVRAHTVRCGHNPVVKALQRLRPVVASAVAKRQAEHAFREATENCANCARESIGPCPDHEPVHVAMLTADGDHDAVVDVHLGVPGSACVPCEGDGFVSCETHWKPLICKHACEVGVCHDGCADKTDREIARAK